MKLPIIVTVDSTPGGAVAKYCDEYVCLCVCLSLCLSLHEDISRTTPAIFLNFVWMLPVSVDRSSSSLWLRLLVTCYTCQLTTLTCLIGSILGVLGR